MAQFKVQTKTGVMYAEATKYNLAPGIWRTKNLRAKVGDEVEIENGLGLKIKGKRVAYNEQADLDVPRTIGTAIKEAREAREITQKELAEELGVSPTYMYTVESGRVNITAKQLARIMEALGAKRLEIKIR